MGAREGAEIGGIARRGLGFKFAPHVVRVRKVRVLALNPRGIHPRGTVLEAVSWRIMDAHLIFYKDMKRKVRRNG